MRTNFLQSRIGLLWLVVLCVIGFGQAKSAYAEYYPPFDFVYCVDHAGSIVMGDLASDGQLRVTRIIRAEAGYLERNTTSLQIKRGAAFHQHFKTTVPEAKRVEVIVFLDNIEQRKTSSYYSELDNPSTRPKIWNTLLSEAGIVGLTGDKAYTFYSGFNQGSAVHERAGYTRESFLKELFHAELLFQQQARLLTQPRTITHAEKVIDFLLQNVQSGSRPFCLPRLPGQTKQIAVVKPGIGFEKIASYFQTLAQPEYRFTAPRARRRHFLKPLSVLETELFISKFKNATTEQRTFLLRLMQYLALHPRYFKQVTSWCERSYPASVRIEAFRLLRSIDHYRAEEFLTRYLQWNEPNLESILVETGFASYRQRCSFKVIDTLEKLLFTWPKNREIAGVDYETERQRVVFGVITHLAHPCLLSELYEVRRLRSNSPDSIFWTLSGLSQGKDSVVSLDAWWKNARDVLRRDYDLNTKAGRKAWFETYQSVDVAGQKLLMNLWWFGPKIDFGALLDATDGSYAESAKAVLAELWENEALPGEVQRAIVAKFVKARLVQVEPPITGRLELRIKCETSFPFPQNSSASCKGVITFDEVPATIDLQRNSVSGSLQTLNGSVFSLGTGNVGQRVAHASLTLTEVSLAKERWKQPIKVDSLLLEYLEVSKK